MTSPFSSGAMAALLVLLIMLGALYYIYLKADKNIECEYAEDVQKCCDDWAKENDIVKAACVGEWKIENKTCSWKCG